jgi:hypothetical protein
VTAGNRQATVFSRETAPSLVASLREQLREVKLANCSLHSQLEQALNELASARREVAFWRTEHAITLLDKGQS